MNNILEVKLRYTHAKGTGIEGFKNLRKNSEVTVEKIEQLQENLKSVIKYYSDKEDIIKGLLIDVCYNDIIAKSRRINELLKPKKKKTNDAIVGARFSDDPDGQEKHIITYYVDKETAEDTLKKLEEAKEFVEKRLNGKATSDNFNENKEKINHLNYGGFSSKRVIRNMIVDCSVVDAFKIPNVTADSERETFLLTFFQTDKPVETLLDNLKIDVHYFPYSFYGKNTISVDAQLYDFLHEKVPYMISMISDDLSKVVFDSFDKPRQQYKQSIPKPNNEPVVGVIDNLFDENAYFSEWVDYRECLDEFDPRPQKNEKKDHGTQVSSIIVDGPNLNPWLDDECGRFKVRHFGVCTNQISVPRLVNKIKEIVNSNPDIHVWNISLGTIEEVSKNFISYDAAVLDELMAKKNVIFVVSGTNDNRIEKKDVIRVGSPADSLNSIVVNSVKRNGEPTSYTRKGNVLSFFNKPDVSYYGGDYAENERIVACSSSGPELVYGTSFAAPWITRKVAFLIDVMGFSREVAKALIIDAAAGWEYKQSTYKVKDKVGYGIVPIKISNILKSDNREIRFILSGGSNTYKTLNYAIPVPRDSDNKYPFISRATLCYFPKCDRNQGVDYTLRELSVKFGRIKSDGKIDDINDNVQDDDAVAVDERQSRKDFRKWENTKFISKILKNNKAIKSYDERLWGISIISKDRLTTSIKENLNFGVVITLREINNINRIQDFIAGCTLRGWIVNAIDIDNKINLYNANQEEIVLE